MNVKHITKNQARKFILLKQGLIGEYSFQGEKGVCDYIKQAGCIQFDPIDVCGKNPELVLQSRVKDFTPQMLYKLLYEERKLIDHFDKNMSIYSVNDWPFFKRNRDRAKEWKRSREDIEAVVDDVKSMIKEKGPLCSSDIAYKEKIDWAWAPTSLSRAALEILYFQGELIIHHKKNTKRYYDFVENHIPSKLLNAEEPNKEDSKYYAWHVARRIGSIGLLWNKASDGWLGINGLKSKERIEAFRNLLEGGEIVEIQVEGIEEPLYMNKGDGKLLNTVIKDKYLMPRTELIAPLDNMLWDRKLIKELFDFEYKWEIYTPVAERKYGYYVLPVLNGDRFVARIEIIKDKKNKSVMVKNLWWEEEVELTSQLNLDLQECIERFGKYHQCKICNIHKVRDK